FLTLLVVVGLLKVSKLILSLANKGKLGIGEGGNQGPVPVPDRLRGGAAGDEVGRLAHSLHVPVASVGNVVLKSGILLLLLLLLVGGGGGWAGAIRILLLVDVPLQLL